VKVNLGCGQAYMEGWTNVDASPDVKADIHLDAAEFVRQYGDQVDEVYMGHVMEHLMPGYAVTLLRLLNEKLPAGTVVSVVTPDMRAIFEAYLAGEVGNDQLNASFIYSYVQPSHHVWCYDEAALTELFHRAGFDAVEAISDPRSYPPVFHKEGPESQWQCGVRALAAGHPVTPAEVAVSELDGIDRTSHVSSNTAVVTPEHELLNRIENLRSALLQEYERRQALEKRVVAEPEPALPVPGGGMTIAEEPIPMSSVGGRRRESAASDADAPTLPSPLTPAGAKARAFGLAKKALPAGSKSRGAALAGLHTYRETRRVSREVRQFLAETGIIAPHEPSYHAWYRNHRPSAGTLKAQRDASAAATQPLTVLVCVLVGPDQADPADRPERMRDIQATIDSVRAQTWAHWQVEVCVGATAAGVDAAPSLAGDRVGVRREDTTVTAAYHAINESDAEFVVFLDGGDRLTAECLYQVARAAWQDPLVDLVTWDDDVHGRDGRRGDPRFRPSWSPEALLGSNYLAQSFAIRRVRALVAGNVRNTYGGATRWDLLLRADLDDERVVRVPRVLSHLRIRRQGVNADGVRAVQEALDARGVPAVAELSVPTVRLRWKLESWPHVTIVIPTRHNRPMLSKVLPGLAATDYPSFDVRIVDNGGQSADNDAWYASHLTGLDADVRWWTTTPFNYSQVNNAAAVGARGEVLVFLNDDVELPDHGWLREIVGWATRPEIGVAGLQLTRADGTVQHAGVILGMGGFADHVFEGMAVDDDSSFGPVGRYRNVLAVTGACAAIRRETFEKLGGFDERFILCGSDVALGLDTTLLGLRNICSPFGGVRHLESVTRGTHVPTEDFFASYWRYNTWLFGGDPYFSPNLSLSSRKPRLRGPQEPTPAQRIAGPIGRNLQVFRQRSDTAEAVMLADACRITDVDIAGVELLHQANIGRLDVHTINWYIPDIDSPFYGGINTALRIADYLHRMHGVQNRFIVWGSPPDYFVRSAITAAFPSLADSEISFFDGAVAATLEQVPPADASIATLWLTAYAVARVQNTKRKFYLIQDFEPMFYPAGTQYALAEESYRMNLYGLCNTENMRQIYADDYRGKGMAFMPAVDPTVFHANNRPYRTEDAPATVFVYARPGHWRNCWELASLALRELKERLGDHVRIVTAGSWATDPEAADAIKQLGLLPYKATGELYRHCDVGLALTVSKHPSYLPLELMACGVPVVAFDNPWGHWILRDGENSLLARRTVTGIVDKLEQACVNPELRRKLASNAAADIAAHHGSWDTAFAGIYDYLCDPEGH
jgi:glycosyltransferase involved in cell wall biosynthesis/GT2 family glycosyltransferase/predicted SAM-dependent methyltransferase